MAWRRPTESDLAATLSQKEIETFRQSSGLEGGDPVADLLLRTAETVRSFCRSCPGLRLGPAGTLPEALVSPAMDYAAYDVLKRLPVKVGDDRRRAREDALALFEKVAAGRVKPESADETGGAAAGAPLAGRARPPRLLD